MNDLRKKPWNRVDAPVYSVVSQYGSLANMNICTYVTPVSMHPKLYLVGLYQGTLTLELVKKNPEFILQFLSRRQYPLVRLLGQQSGHKVPKIERLRKRKLLSEWKGFPVLEEAIALLHLSVIRQWPGGDHSLFLCKVVSYQNRHTGPALELSLLKQKKLIRS